MKKNFICLLAVICMMLCVSCEKYSGVSRPNDIYAYWQLQNEVKFNGMGFTNLIFTSSEKFGCENFVDPVISDTIYHYKKVEVKGDMLCLVDDNDKVLKAKILELNDERLVLTDFPGVDGVLIYKHLDWGPGEDPRRCKEDSLKGLSAFPEKIIFRGASVDYPADSLDIIMKSSYFFKCYNEYGDDKAVVLTKDQMTKARYILKKYMARREYLKEEGFFGSCCGSEPYDFNKYIHTYYGIIKDGELLVCVKMCADGGFGYFPYTSLKEDIPLIHDGGNILIHVLIDLKQNKVVYFQGNGCA
jgi:hypothetical protein